MEKELRYSVGEFSTVYIIHSMDLPESRGHDRRWGSHWAMHKKWYLKDPYADFPPMPFTTLDYLLCALVFLLIGIASNAQLADLIASIRK